MTMRPLLPTGERVRRANLGSEGEHSPGAVIATDDAALIRQWASQHSAEPATGEATASGPATVDVQDGGAGIRFNFPGAARFRSITWDEWFENFQEYDLLFVYERDAPGTTSGGNYRLVPKHMVAAE